MNTIKIFFQTSGSIATVQKDFPLYQYSYQNKLLNVYVPTSVLQPDFQQLQNGVPVAEYVAGTAIKIGMTYLARDGKIKKSKSYYMRYLKTLTYQGIEYALFERMLPQEFTLYAGQGQNAPTLIANAVVIQTDVTPHRLLRIITTQTCTLDVLDSANLDNEETVDPSELDQINARLNSIDAVLPLKQNITDETLNTENKTIVGAINEVKAVNDAQDTQIAENTENIAKNRNSIDEILEFYVHPETYIGQLTGSTLPTDDQLTNFVQATLHRDPRNADVVIFIWEIEGQTDRNYKYIYSSDGWNGYEIPPLETADNGTLGIVRGTYAVGSTNPTLVDISAGEILNIYVKDTNNSYRNIREYANSLNTTISNIIAGSVSVGLAMRALQDGLGNNIVNTYLTQNAGATKQYVHDYALPREFNEVYFISNAGYQKTVPTVPASGIQFTEMSDAVGDTQLFQIIKTNTAEFELSSKNSSQNVIYVSASENCAVQFRLTTQFKKGSLEWQNLSVELSNMVNLTANEIQKLSFGMPFSALEENVISLLNGDMIRQTLEVITQTSDMIVFDVYSNETYPSSYSMNVLSQRIVTSQGYLGEQPSFTLTGTYTNNLLTFTLPDTVQLYNNVEAEFNLIVPYDNLPSSTAIKLVWQNQDIRVVTPYNIENGDATLDNLKQVYIDNVGNDTTYIFKGFIKISATSEITVNVDEDNLIDYADREFVSKQDELFIGRIIQLDFNAVLENNQIIASLDSTIDNFEFIPNTAYIFHIYLPLVTLTGDLDNSYPIILNDRNGNPININCIFQRELGETSTVGDLCQLQNYLPTIGYTWDFSAYYRQPLQNGNIVRYVYTDAIIRETNGSMRGQDFAINLASGKIKNGNTTLITSTYSSGNTTYLQGHTYLVTSEFVGGSLVFTASDITEEAFADKLYSLTLEISDWSSSASISPYKYVAQKQLNGSFDNKIVELINDNPIAFANYGIALASIEDNMVTFYAVNVPRETLNLKLGVYDYANSN